MKKGNISGSATAAYPISCDTTALPYTWKSLTPYTAFPASTNHLQNLFSSNHLSLNLLHSFATVTDNNKNDDTQPDNICS